MIMWENNLCKRCHKGSPFDYKAISLLLFYPLIPLMRTHSRFFINVLPVCAIVYNFESLEENSVGVG